MGDNGNVIGLIEDSYHPSSIPLLSVDINAEVLNLTTNVTTTFVYKNEFDWSVNTAFQFPTTYAAIYHFEAELGGRKIISQCRTLAEATSTYTEAVASGHTAFLGRHVEQSEDRFRMQLGIIPPGATVVINLKYISQLDAEVVDSNMSKVTLTLPSVMNPRYSPEGTQKPCECGVFEDTPMTNAIPYKISFCAALHMQHPISEVTSAKDSFDLEYSSEDHRRAKATLVSDFKSDHDLQLTVVLHDPLTHLLAYEPGDSSQTGLLSMHCLMAQFIPEFSTAISRREDRTEIVFVIDRSGSMEGTNIEHASASLLLFLKSLPSTCRFQIIGFGSEHAALFDRPVDYTEDTLARALAYQRALDADMGGTEVYPALMAAFEAPLTGQGWYRQVIFITDGDVLNANEIIGLVKRNVEKARVFAIGIGEGANTFLVPGVAAAGRGLAAFVRDSCQLQAAVMKILNTALQPRADDIHVTWTVQSRDRNTAALQPVDVVTIPKYVAPVFSGCFLTAFALFHGDTVDLTGGVELTYEITGRKQRLHVSLDQASLANATSSSADAGKDLPLHRLAGKCQLTELSNEYRAVDSGTRGGQSDEVLARLRGQIEQLSTGINVLSMHTALVGVDPVRTSDPSAAADQLVSVPILTAGMPIGFGTDEVDFCPGPGEFPSPCMLINECQLDCLEPMEGAATMGSPFRHEQEVPSPGKEKPKDPIILLADLQQFSGSWQLTKDLASCLNISVNQIMSSLPKSTIPQPKTKPVVGEECVWATVLVLEFFNIRLFARQDEWILLAEKASSWLTERVGLSVTTILKLRDSARVLLVKN